MIDQTHPALKKKENFKEVLIHNHSQQIFSADLLSRFSSADLLSRFSQQIFLADLLSRSSQQIFLSRSSQQIFSADLLSRFSQQSFSADLLSRSSQQIFSADLLSRSSQQIFSADFLSRSSQQIFSADLLICCGQGLVVSYCLIILIICCGQGLVVSYCLIICCGQGLVVSYCLIILVVYVGGLYCMSSLEGPFRGAFGKKRRGSVCDILPFQINPNQWFIMRWVDAWCNYKWWVSNHPENTRLLSRRTTSPPQKGSLKTKNHSSRFTMNTSPQTSQKYVENMRIPSVLCYANRWYLVHFLRKRNMDEPQKKTVNIVCFGGISFPNKNCMYTSHILSVWDFSEAQPKNIQAKMVHN